MRKTIIASNGYALAAEHAPVLQQWLDLASLARVEISSEDVAYPVERAFTTGVPGVSGWQAGSNGPQTLRLHFDNPQKVSRVLVHFRDTEQERMQEFSLEAMLAGGRKQEIVRQQWSFSPGGSTEEQENYQVKLDGVVALTLWIDPDRGRDRYPATLLAFRVEG